MARGAAGLLAGILGLAAADWLLEGLTIDGFGPLVLAALSEKKATPAELAEIRRLLDELETKR